MSEPDLVFIMYPEVYAILTEGLKNKRWSDDERRRVLMFVSAWEAVRQTIGEKVAKLHIFAGIGRLSFQVYEMGLNGYVLLNDE